MRVVSASAALLAPHVRALVCVRVRQCGVRVWHRVSRARGKARAHVNARVFKNVQNMMQNPLALFTPS